MNNETKGQRFEQKGKCKHGAPISSPISNGAKCDLKEDGTILKLHDKCPNVIFTCQKRVTFTPKQFQLQGNGLKNK